MTDEPRATDEEIQEYCEDIAAFYKNPMRLGRTFGVMIMEAVLNRLEQSEEWLEACRKDIKERHLPANAELRARVEELGAKIKGIVEHGPWLTAGDESVCFFCDTQEPHHAPWCAYTALTTPAEQQEEKHSRSTAMNQQAILDGLKEKP